MAVSLTGSVAGVARTFRLAGMTGFQAAAAPRSPAMRLGDGCVRLRRPQHKGRCPAGAVAQDVDRVGVEYDVVVRALAGATAALVEVADAGNAEVVQALGCGRRICGLARQS